METTIKDFKTPQYVAIPTALLVVLVAVVLRRNGGSKKAKVLIDELENKIAGFTPEPLVQEEELYVEPVLKDIQAIQNGLGFKEVQNLLSNDYLSLCKNGTFKQIGENCIRNNGVGSCGPRGFYGTIDIHLDLETKLADFMGLEESVIYSYALSTMSSAILAYCKRGDLVFCDEKICYGSMQGLIGSRATIICFRHNDMEDLEKKLIENNPRGKKPVRKFLLVEGIYEKTGTMCPLPEIMRMREKYMLRMFLDESITFAALGETGHGLTEYFNVDRKDIDLIVGSLENSLGSIGGFCVGSSFIIEHQRLSGLGYCFSASLPPYLSLVALNAISLFEKKPETFGRLKKVSNEVQKRLRGIKGISVISHEDSPRKVFACTGITAEKFVEKCKQQGLILEASQEGIRFNVHLDMDDTYIAKLVEIFKWACANY